MRATVNYVLAASDEMFHSEQSRIIDSDSSVAEVAGFLGTWGLGSRSRLCLKCNVFDHRESVAHSGLTRRKFRVGRLGREEVFVVSSPLDVDDEMINKPSIPMTAPTCSQGFINKEVTVLWHAVCSRVRFRDASSVRRQQTFPAMHFLQTWACTILGRRNSIHRSVFKTLTRRYYVGRSHGDALFALQIPQTII